MMWNTFPERTNLQQISNEKNIYPEFNKEKCRLGAFVVQFLQATSFVWKFVGNLSNIHSL